MAQTQKSRRGWHPERLSGNVVDRDVPEHASPLLDRQAKWLAARLGLTLERARLLVGLAFGDGRPA